MVSIRHLILAILCLLSLTPSVNAQIEQSRSVVATGGTTWDNGNMEVSFTMGESVISTWDNGTTITSGFQQPTTSTAGIDDLSTDALILYPNPATTTIFITGNQGDLNYTILDVTGRVVREGTITMTGNRIDISALICGKYFLRFDQQHIPFIKIN